MKKIIVFTWMLCILLASRGYSQVAGGVPAEPVEPAVIEETAPAGEAVTPPPAPERREAVVPETRPREKTPDAPKDTPREKPAERAVEATGQGDGSGLLDITDGDFRIERIPGISLKKYTPAQEVLPSADTKGMMERISGIRLDFVKIGVVVLLFFLFIIYKSRSGRKRRRY